ncbi:hypothetical protein ACLKA7_009873 [Drosophila subpalustris]
MRFASCPRHLPHFWIYEIKKMKSSTYELHNYAELDMELDSDQMQSEAKGSRKRKANNATGCRRGEKYSLRQKRQKRIPGEPATTPMPSSPATEMESTAATTTKATPTASKAKSSAKSKAPPLSKYRRKTANARERTRMREINMAFEQLRHCVPQSITGEDAASTNEKLTKITTLRLAMKYIGMLSESLQDPSYESDFLVECLRESASRDPHVSLDTDPEAEAEPEYELELEPAPVKSKKQSKASKKTPAKRQSKQTKTKIGTTAAATTSMTSTADSSPESCYASSSVGSPAFCAVACSPSSAYASLSSSASTSSSSSSSDGAAPLDADSLLGMQALSELNTLLLESDSESLHVFDPDYQSLLASAGSMLPARGDLPISMHSPLDKPDVELSLRLLDHSTDSFDFASDQQPSACISPLATLDSFHPFADLLHGEFPDLFLA